VQCRDAQHGDGVCCAFAPQLVHLLYHTVIQEAQLLLRDRSTQKPVIDCIVSETIDVKMSNDTLD